MGAVRTFFFNHWGWVCVMSGLIPVGLAFSIAGPIADRYPALERGYLGVCVMYLLVRRYISPRKATEIPIQVTFQFRALLRYLLFLLLLSLAVYWASREAIVAVRAVLKMF